MVSLTEWLLFPLHGLAFSPFLLPPSLPPSLSYVQSPPGANKPPGGMLSPGCLCLPSLFAFGSGPLASVAGPWVVPAAALSCSRTSPLAWVAWEVPVQRVGWKDPGYPGVCRATTLFSVELVELLVVLFTGSEGRPLWSAWAGLCLNVLS